ncbi:MAG: class I SAM-dependent rRNA methyltransferase [Actinomycetota bacterium]|jgi:23S rRNA (cytosine1962-C5)-methyltransferase
MTLLNDLPRPGSARLAVRVTPDALRRIRGGHPWLFDGSITTVNGSSVPTTSATAPGTAGDLAVIFDDERRFAAIGLWDPASPIRVKLLHHGSPTTIDAAWFAERLATAVGRRRPLAESATGPAPTTGYRLVHGENDALPGLVVDRYGHVLVVKLYSAAWVPHLADVVPALLRLVPSRSVVLRLARALSEQPLHGLAEGTTLHGSDVDAPVPFLEHGLHFEADVLRGQKTGFFLDQRDNRALVGAASSGARVLDVFSCTGGFSVHAAAGGARSVLSVDSSPAATLAARANMQLNTDIAAVAACRHSVTVGEAFGVLEDLGSQRGRFDVVVVDPPSFARNAVSVPRALQAYQRLAELAAPLVERGGLLVHASCSARVSEADFVRAIHTGSARASIELDEERRTGHPLDHPIGFPEGGYLKVLYSRPHRITRRP